MFNLVGLVDNCCLQVLKKFGVKKFDPTNEPFDPHMHNAIFQIPDASKAPGTVGVVLKVFYILVCSLCCTTIIFSFRCQHLLCPSNLCVVFGKYFQTQFAIYESRLMCFTVYEDLFVHYITHADYFHC